MGDTQDIQEMKPKPKTVDAGHQLPESPTPILDQRLDFQQALSTQLREDYLEKEKLVLTDTELTALVYPLRRRR